MSATTAFRSRIHRESAPPSCSRPRRTTATASTTAATATNGIDERTGDGSTRRNDDRQHGLNDLAGAALPDDRPHATADVLHLTAVTDAAVDVAGDAGRKREVEEERPVVRGDGGRQGQAEAEAARDDRPAPRTADRRDEPDGRRRQRERGRRPTRSRRRTGRCRCARSRRRAPRSRVAGPAHRRTCLTAAPAGRRGRR